MSNQPPAGPPPEWSQAGPPPPPVKKRKKWPFILGAIVVVIIIIAVATSGGSKDDDTSTTADSTTATSAAPAGSGQAAPPAAATTTTTKKADGHTLVYEVTGDSGTAGNITYFAKGGNQSQETNAALPFRKEITSDDKSDFTIAGVTAQNGGDGAISCKVTIDGKVEAENTSNGQFAVVSCTASPF